MSTEDAATIPLSRGLVAIVDQSDYERLMEFRWYASVPVRQGATAYARRWESPRRMVHMHREVLGVSVKVDHANGNGLDNRRTNLRVATTSQNAANSRVRKQVVPKTSNFRGVSWVERDHIWTVRIVFGGKQYNLGSFLDERQAAIAYDTAAREAFGAFARCNFGEAND